MYYNLRSALPNTKVGRNIKELVKGVYKEVYDADIEPNPDEYIYLEKDNKILASFSLTYKSNKKLFSECYFDKPLEELYNIFNTPITCEVGSCVSLKQGLGVQLYKLLPYILTEKKSFCALVTLTGKVQMIFNKLNFVICYLTDAFQEKAPKNGSWGTFYETKPKTYVFDALKSCVDISLEEYAKSLGINYVEVGNPINVLGQNNIKSSNKFIQQIYVYGKEIRESLK